MEKNSQIQTTVAEQPEPNLVRRLLHVKPRPIPTTRSENPKIKSFVLGRISWSWLSELFYTGFGRYLEVNDIWKVNQKEAIEPLMKDYRAERNRLISRGSSNPHWRAILYAIRWKFALACTITVLTFAAEISLPVISRPTIEIIQQIYRGESTKYSHAAGYAVGNTLVTLVWIYLQLWSGYFFTYVGQVMRGLLIAVVFDKSLSLSAVGHSEYPPSLVTSYITTDTTRIFAASRWTAQTISAIPAGAAILGILIHYLGVAALPGFGLILLGCVATAVSSRFISVYRGKSLPFADKRIKCVTETIENIKILKYYGWESSYVEKISEYRRQEEGYLVKNGQVESVNSSIISCVPYFAGLLAFAIRSVITENMDPSRIFPALTLFLIFQPITQYFSDGINAHADAYTSYKRLQEYFAADEDLGITPLCSDPKNAIEIRDGIFKWISKTEAPAKPRFTQRLIKAAKFWAKSEEPTDTASVKAPTEAFISCDRLNVAAGELVMVVGPTGSGKTSLLNAISGVMPKVGGERCINGKISASMDNWSMSGTVRENILFGAPFNHEIYDQAVEACGLRADLSNLSDGDLTHVGERGVTLSGGQKARVALARAVYHTADIILLDDVLSAVDSKVGNQIFNQCILGFLGSRTRVMSTHDPKLLKHADKIIYTHKSTTTVGTLSDLQAIPEFAELLVEELKEEEEEEQEESEKKEGSEDDDEQSSNVTAEEEEDDERVRGHVDSDVLFTYMRKGAGFWMVPAIIITLCLIGAAKVMQSIFLSWWTSDKFGQSRGWYIGIYAALICALCIVTILLEFCLCAFCLRASSGLHNAAIRNVYRAPMAYFDSIPMGRIITRLTDDIAQLDMMIYILMRMSFPGVTTVLAMLITVFVYLPWTILCVVPIIVFTAGSVYYYRASSREITRICGIFRSKVFGHVTESMGGMSTIVGFNRGAEFENKLNEYINDFNSASFINTATQFWVGLRIMLSTLPVTFVVIMLCAFHIFHLDASTVAMILSLLPTIFVTLASTMVILVELEKEMNSVERVYELGYKIPQEGPFEIEQTKPPPSWPQSGNIQFMDVSLRYRPQLPLVLKDFTLNVANEKLGICGRTGAGKSSLLASLFRLAELDSGKILIDGVDISTIGLSDLRKRLSIIPQDPVLFAGTIRSNLDPFNEHPDAELWDALKRSGVTQSDNDETKFHLDSEVESKGSNFSLGQRQLLTLARAIVRKSRIIALDEATSNVDRQTDAHVQKTLATQFSESTILCVAHRLDTILKYDRILVMDQGQLVELGTPSELFHKGGIFTELCVESGINAAQIERQNSL